MSKNPWFPPPSYKIVEYQKAIAKINDKLKPNEIEIEIPFNDMLIACGSKSIKVKILTEKREEFDKHYFDLQVMEERQSKLKCVLCFPKDVESAIKKCVLMISIKKKTLGFIKYLLPSQEINLNHFQLVNELSKQFKFKEQG